MSRWKASAIHFLISAAIAAVVAVIFLQVWYPPPFFAAAGADELMLLLVGVDIVIGPLITLIVFRAGKPGLKFDLGFIATVQTCALIYGVFITLQSRPVFLVAAIDRFVLVSANDLDPDSLQRAADPFRRLSWTGPQLVGLALPSDPAKRSELMFSAGGKNPELEQKAEFYVAYEQQAQTIVAHARPLATLRQNHPDAAQAITALLGKAGIDEARVAYVPLLARKHDLSMLVGAETGQPLGALAVDPW